MKSQHRQFKKHMNEVSLMHELVIHKCDDLELWGVYNVINGQTNNMKSQQMISTTIGNSMYHSIA